jgi:hypothetical protein
MYKFSIISQKFGTERGGLEVTSTHLFGRCLVRFSAGTSAILVEHFFLSFLRFPFKICWDGTKIRSRTLQIFFLIDRLPYHLMLHSRDTEKRC